MAIRFTMLNSAWFNHRAPQRMNRFISILDTRLTHDCQLPCHICGTFEFRDKTTVLLGYFELFDVGLCEVVGVLPSVDLDQSDVLSVSTGSRDLTVRATVPDGKIVLQEILKDARQNNPISVNVSFHVEEFLLFIFP